MIDFIKLIGESVELTVAQKTQMLNDFCENLNYQMMLRNPTTGEEFPNPESKKDFANRKITEFIKSSVHQARRKRAEVEIDYEKLEI